jgi:hypothetical protein
MNEADAACPPTKETHHEGKHRDEESPGNSARTGMDFACVR